MISYTEPRLLVHGPDLEGDNGVFLSGVYFPVPSLCLTSWSTEQFELTRVETETLKCSGEWAPEWTSNRLSPCASLLIRERPPQHHALTSYWPELGHRAIFKSQGRLEKTVSGVSRHFPGGQTLPLGRRGKGMAAGLHSS